MIKFYRSNFSDYSSGYEESFRRDLSSSSFLDAKLRYDFDCKRTKDINFDCECLLDDWEPFTIAYAYKNLLGDIVSFYSDYFDENFKVQISDDLVFEHLEDEEEEGFEDDTFLLLEESTLEVEVLIVKTNELRLFSFQFLGTYYLEVKRFHSFMQQVLQMKE